MPFYFAFTYDTSVVDSFYPKFNNGYKYTSYTSISGNLKTVRIMSDDVFTSVSIPESRKPALISVDYIDLSGCNSISGF